MSAPLDKIALRQRLIRENPGSFNEGERAWAELPFTTALADGDLELGLQLRTEEEARRAASTIHTEPSKPPSHKPKRKA